MTERKPAAVSFESWVDRQIREAAEQGQFAQLPGLGKPMVDHAVPYDDLWWIKQKVVREGISVILNPTLALRKEIEDVLAAVAEAPYEQRVRDLLEPLNKKIAENLRMPPPGPPLKHSVIDVDQAVAEWRQAHVKSRAEEPVEEPSHGRKWRLRLPRLRRRR